MNIVYIFMQLKSKLKEKLDNLFRRWNGLEKSQKLSLFVISFFVLALPVSLFAISRPVRLFSRATYPVTPPITPPFTPFPTPSESSISWVTDYLALKAEGFKIVASGVEFSPTNSSSSPYLSSGVDPNNPKYIFFEATWTEAKGKINFYLHIKSDNNYWWADKIKITYSQDEVYPRTVEYSGSFFKTPLGKPFFGENLTFYPNLLPYGSCAPRPSCLDAKPPCKMVQPAGGWCPDRAYPDEVRNNYIHFDKLMILPRFSEQTAFPRPTPSPRITPTPTSSPLPNSNPKIKTNALPNGRVGKKYSFSIEGIDSDPYDNLNMSINNLPPGIKMGKCLYSVVEPLMYRIFSQNKPSASSVSVSCTIEGTPKIPGVYRVDILLWDQRGGSDHKSLTLKVDPVRRFNIFGRFSRGLSE